ncbi:MAG: CDP-glycerol glycerophosphotransferase family protein [Clostridiales bacterium]|nr:CDP-glycerol glycerophosphotransferase family protein [Clostridiales bacterium]
MEDIRQTSYYRYLKGIFMLLFRYFPKKNIIIVLHPRTHGLLDNEIFSSCIWEKPIAEALCQAKLLITDYSSVCYNTFYQGGGVVFFQKDLKYYERQNGKLIPQDDEYIGKRVFSFSGLQELLDEGIENGRILLDRFRTNEFEHRYLAINEFTDGKNTEQICKALKDYELI